MNLNRRRSPGGAAVGDEAAAARAVAWKPKWLRYEESRGPVVCGNSIAFRKDLTQSGFLTRLRDFVESGGQIVAASGGAMQITPNLSLYPLLTADVDHVLRVRDSYEGLNLVGFEFLPHLNKHDARFLEKARRYSHRARHQLQRKDRAWGVRHRPHRRRCANSVQ